MAFHAFNFGKQLGLMGNTGIDSGIDPRSVDSSQTLMQHRATLSETVPTGLSPSTGGMPPVEGRAQTEIRNHFVDCPEGASITWLDQKHSMSRGGSDVPPTYVIDNYFGCIYPHRGSGGAGGGVEGPLDRGRDPDERPLTDAEQILNDIDWQCPKVRGDDSCCTEQQKAQISAAFAKLLSKESLGRFPGMKECLRDSLKGLKVRCVKGTPSANLGLNNPQWDTYLLDAQKFNNIGLNPDLVSHNDFLLLASIISKCGVDANKGKRGFTNLDIFAALGMEPSLDNICDIINSQIRREGRSYEEIFGPCPPGGGKAGNKYVGFDPCTGQVYYLNNDGTKGSEFAQWPAYDISKCR